jgi:hypothetical protein
MLGRLASKIYLGEFKNIIRCKVVSHSIVLKAGSDRGLLVIQAGRRKELKRKSKQPWATSPFCSLLIYLASSLVYHASGAGSAVCPSSPVTCESMCGNPWTKV